MRNYLRAIELTVEWETEASVPCTYMVLLNYYLNRQQVFGHFGPPPPCQHPSASENPPADVANFQNKVLKSVFLTFSNVVIFGLLSGRNIPHCDIIP